MLEHGARQDVASPSGCSESVFADPAQAVDAFWARYPGRGSPDRACVDYLTDFALSADRERAEHGTRALFAEIVEPLCDAFTPTATAAYERVFARVVTRARAHPVCRVLDRALAGRGIRSELDVLRGLARARTFLPAGRRGRIRSVTVLSRLTLGADVAIVLPVLERVRMLFPKATLAIVGSGSAGALARSVPGVRHFSVTYGRLSNLDARLNAWPALCAAIEASKGAAAPEEHVIIDPDSRLTQLGLLPPDCSPHYFHFPSRSYASKCDGTLGHLVERWLAETFGECAAGAARLALAAEDLSWANALRSRVAPARPLVSVSFGVGGNDRKRVGLGFEVDVIEWLARRGCAVLLSRGVTPEEIVLTQRRCRRLVARGIDVVHLPRGRSLTGLDNGAPHVVTWEADVGAFFAAIACADAYVGYDSAGQHVAAALGTPTLSIFVEAAGRRHGQRWTPRGMGPVRVVRSALPPDGSRIFAHACAAFESLTGDSRKP